MLQNRVVHVRGTPAGGRSVLARLMLLFIQTEQSAFKAHLINGVDTETYPSGWLEMLRHKTGIAFPDAPSLVHCRGWVLLIDEAQMSYGCEDFWTDAIKDLAIVAPVIRQRKLSSSCFVPLAYRRPVPLSCRPDALQSYSAKRSV